MRANQKPVKYICIIKWVDPQTDSSWLGRKEAEKIKPVDVVSVGLYINEDDQCVRISLDHSADDGFNGVGVIPKGCILKMRKIPLPVAFTS